MDSWPARAAKTERPRATDGAGPPHGTENQTTMNTKTTGSNAAARKPYEKPQVHSERMFETNALACGKCSSGPVSQYHCGTLLMNS